MKKILSVLAAVSAALTISVCTYAVDNTAVRPSIVFDLDEGEQKPVAENEIILSEEEEDGRLFLENSQQDVIAEQENGNDEPSFTIQQLGKMALISFVIGLIIALVICLIMKSRMKTAVPKVTANDYVKENSFNISRSRDIFVYANVTKKKREKEEKK